MKLSKVWIIQMWWNSSKFSKMRQSTLALAVYQLQICNVLDVGRKIFALSWSYSKAWFIDPGRFSFRHFLTLRFSLHLGTSLLDFIEAEACWSESCHRGVSRSPKCRRVGPVPTNVSFLNARAARFLLEVLGACRGKKSLHAAISKSKVRVLSTKISDHFMMLHASDGHSWENPQLCETRTSYPTARIWGLIQEFSWGFSSFISVILF